MCSASGSAVLKYFKHKTNFVLLWFSATSFNTRLLQRSILIQKLFVFVTGIRRVWGRCRGLQNGMKIGKAKTGVPVLTRLALWGLLLVFTFLDHILSNKNIFFMFYIKLLLLWIKRSYLRAKFINWKFKVKNPSLPFFEE